MFKEKMVTPAIPERVFYLCKILEKGAMTSSDLKEKMEPSYLGGTTYFYDYKNAAEELGLISISDDMLSLAVDEKVIEDMDTMRRYINSRLEHFKEGKFYKVTRAYLEQGNEVLTINDDISSLSTLFRELIGDNLDPTEMRAWRFWASFLGFGYPQDMFIIPNANVFIWDIIVNSTLKKGEKYSIDKFVDEITPMANIIIPNNGDKNFNFAASNGLRTLEHLGKIRIEHILDQKDIWTLYPMKAYPASPYVTHITII